MRCNAAAIAEAVPASTNGASAAAGSNYEKLYGRQYFPLAAVVGQVWIPPYLAVASG